MTILRKDIQSAPSDTLLLGRLQQLEESERGKDEKLDQLNNQLKRQDEKLNQISNRQEEADTTRDEKVAKISAQLEPYC